MSVRSRARRRRLPAVALVAGGAVALAGCTGNAATTQGKPARPYLTAKTSTHTVHLMLLAGAPEGPGAFDFNGASAGRMTVTVPLGWHVDVLCLNYANELSNSCAIVPPHGDHPAFPGSATKHPFLGLRPGYSESFSFTASKVGNYQIVSLAAGHRDAGMWDRFIVRRHVRPSIKGAIGVPTEP